MKKTLLTALALTLTLVGGPAFATPERKVIAYDELMVLVPGLEDLGYSRITTVEACQAFTGVVDWTEMLTDTEFEVMEACLIEHT
jgi:hypothetical protein